MGMSIDEILISLNHLTPSQIHSALAYYFDHQNEIDADLEKASDTEFWKAYIISGISDMSPLTGFAATVFSHTRQ